jgi:transposase
LTDSEHKATTPLDFQQTLKLAKDLNQLYTASRRLRGDLAEEKVVTQYRLQEVKGLNQLMQKVLDDYRELQETHTLLVRRLHQALGAPEEADLCQGLKQALAEASASYDVADGGTQGGNRAA